MRSLWPLFIAGLNSAAFAQDDAEKREFQKRVSVETRAENGDPWVRTKVDGFVVYDGPGRDAAVELVTSSKLDGQRFLTVTVDAQEEVRLWVTSLKKPLKLPIAAPEKSPSLSTSSTNGRVTVRVGDEVVYEGPGSQASPDAKTHPGHYVVVVDGYVVYRRPLGGAARESDTKSREVPAGGQDRDPKEDVLARLNDVRKRIGIPVVEEDKGLSSGCQLHASYLAKNQGRKEIEGAGMHSQDSSLPGYSEEGKKSAAQSLVAYFSRGRSPVRGIDFFLSTLYHRLPLIHPRLVAVGLGIADLERGGGVLVVDTSKRNVKDPVSINPVLYPMAEQVDVPTHFALGGWEWPDPRPEKSGKCGFPITAQWDTRDFQPAEVSATLECDGKQLEAWLSSPSSPARNDKGQPGVVCLMPKQALKAGTKYVVTLRCKNEAVKDSPEWSKKWSFTTSK